MSLRNSHYAYIPAHMHKTLPTLGNEKEQQQIKFYEKSLGEFIFLRATKNPKNPDWASAQKLRLHYWHVFSFFKDKMETSSNCDEYLP